MDLPEKVILFTGVTSGIGLVLVERIACQFEKTHQLHFCVTCRNMNKGKSLEKMLAINHESVQVTLIKVDIGDVKSILEGCNKIRKRFSKMDCMYLNAGIMPVKSFNWKNILKSCLLDLNAVEMFRTGYGMFNTTQLVNDDGINEVFATNVLGHYVLVQEMIPLLEANVQKKLSQIIWTTSANATKDAYNPNDLTCKLGPNAYSNSKYVMEATSIELNERYNSKGIYSQIADPGTAITSLTLGILPMWIWYIFLPILWMVRLLLPNLTLTPYNACQSLLWLLQQCPEDLDPGSRYCSQTSLLKGNYTVQKKIDITPGEANSIYNKVSVIAEELLSKYT
ncbi:3-keto-steroid reductase/17-beta-hydroxysteroid dehydrogenase 7-like [Clavelina lepadiformis]|uniref:3-keto-steroid reductase/17-beta-hydroxysteroid dehydrogenase 7-like n=1 Tax=Clavelina lepadiformis TaxID=159417 RepID=UPI0040438C32